MSTAGVVDGMPHNEYLNHPALSVSGMKMLLPPGCPALFRYYQDHPRPSKRAYDFGHVVHSLVLDDGPQIVPIDADDWRTKDARAQRDEAYAAGQVPILAHEYTEAETCAASVKAHPLAGSLLRQGEAEKSLFWEDKETGVRLRGRLDWLTTRPGGRVIAVDLKTAANADNDSFSKTAAAYGYHRQAVHYLEALMACGIADDPSFVFVVVEKEPPYLVNVIQLDADAERIGRQQIRQAINTYKQCIDTNTWPGYSSGVELVGLPVYYQRQNEDINT
jgi:hypothetical protein